MRTTTLAFFLVFSAVLAPLSTTNAADPDCKNLEEWIPADVIGYVKLNGAGDHLKKLVRWISSDRVQDTAIAKHLRNDEKAVKFFDELGKFKKATGKKPVDFLVDLFGREVVVGVRLSFEGPELFILTRSKDASTLTSTLETIKTAVTERIGVWPIGRVDSYEGHAIHGAEKVAYTEIGEVLVIGSSASAVRQVIDLSRGKGKKSVANSESFAPARRVIGKGKVASLVVRPRYIPGYEVPEKADNFVAGLLAGSWLVALKDSDLMMLSLGVGKRGLELEMSVTVDDESLVKEFECYFPKVVPDDLTRRLRERGALATFKVHRDFYGWWQKSGDFILTRGIGEMLQFTQVMNLVFGRSFEDEVLPEFKSTLTLVAHNQSYADLGSPPEPAIPGFAAIFQMNHPEEFGRRMQVALQSLVGLININQAQEKKDASMLLVESEKIGDVRFFTVNRADELSAKSGLGIEYNFSPSLAIVADRMVISSSRELGKILVEELSKKPGSKTGSAQLVSDRLVVNMKAVRDILEQNFKVLVAKNMVSKGQSRAEAEGEIGAILELLQLFRGVRLDSGIRDGALRLRLRVGVANSSKTKS